MRLEREELDARGFVTNLERLLLAADDSANGKLAARLIGVIAGSGDKPTTILDLTNGNQGTPATAGRNGGPKNASRSRGAAKTMNGAHSEHEVQNRGREARRRSKLIPTRRNPAMSTS